ncbi:MAG: hypothetical protein ACETWM_13050 [Candidatus Lokiarchaeia archaeon]
MLKSIAEILVSCLGFAYDKPCRYLISEEGKLTRCALDYSVPICKGIWCEPITEELMITTCDKLADVARSLPNKISCGVTDLDLFLCGGCQFTDNVAVIGEPRTMTFLAMNIIVTVNKRNVKSYYYTTSKGTRLNTIKKMIEKIGVKSCMVEDIVKFYEEIREGYQLVDKLKDMLNTSQKEDYEGLLIIRDSILKYIKDEALFPKKILEWEEKIQSISLRSMLTISMFESNILEDEIRDFIMDTFSLVIKTCDNPPSFKILKTEQGRPSDWIQVDLTVP